MTAENELGRSITQATRFLWQIHEDVGQLLVSLDGLMAARGWVATEKNKVSDCLSNDLRRPGCWVQSYLYRWYHPRGAEGSIETLLAFDVLFDPPDPFGEPLVFMTASVFPGPVTWGLLAQQWSDTIPSLEAVRDATEPQVLTPETFAAFQPSASRLAAFAVPLCSLTSSDQLLSRCVEPMFKALASLEAA